MTDCCAYKNALLVYKDGKIWPVQVARVDLEARRTWEKQASLRQPFMSVFNA